MMRNLLYILLLAPLLVFVSSCEEESNNVEPLYEIGDVAEGGIVFYIDETGEHGLVAALEDLTEGATDPYEWGDNGYEWGCYLENVSGADAQWIGAGLQNTTAIISQACQTENGGISAVQAVLDAEIEGYFDWYLPSVGELYQMYLTIGKGSENGNIGSFSSYWYWSSSELGNDPAWAVNFSNGDTNLFYKYSTNRVRVIRAF